MNPPNNTPKNLSIGIIIILIISPFFMATALSLQLTTTSEYVTHVHSSPGKNCTFLEKPMYPVMINSSQILIGGNWTIICQLQANHDYQVYIYGTWVNISSSAKTDYDIYVYNPQGNLESSHTEAAGLPEHLGTTTNDKFFTPAQSGNYSFVIKNDPRESEGTQQATFMIMENLETDKWYTSFVEGKDANSSSSFHTNWAYEFVTNQSKVELYINVPKTLDMYEARLYLMNNAKSLNINGVPLPFEQGLYGNVSGSVGGYNFESEGYRGVAYASCEYPGEPMFLTYTLPTNATSLYHLVLIGEEGSGNVEFILKTRFENASLTPIDSPKKVYTNNPAKIAFMTDKDNLEQAQLSYTTDRWNHTASIDMIISNQTCNATIPGQKAGSLVQYRITGFDVLKNNITATGNYTVKDQATLNITAVKDEIQLGDNINITGILTPSYNDSKVQIKIYNANTTQNANCTVLSDGTFTANLKPASSGKWAVIASSAETNSSYKCDSQSLTITVIEPPLYIKYSLFIIIGMVAAGGGGGAVWFLKFRNK
jgi:hypothetical protein